MAEFRRFVNGIDAQQSHTAARCFVAIDRKCQALECRLAALSGIALAAA